MTKNQRRAEAREIARREREKRQKRQKMRKIAIRAGVTVGVVALLVAIGGGIWLSTRPEGPGPANLASGGVLFTGSGGEISVVETPGQPAGEDPIPNDTAPYGADANIVSYLDFGCEYCKAFETTNGAQIEEMVSSGSATLEVVPVAITGSYAVRAASAVACMVEYQPESFFDMLPAMYDNQPAEGGTLTNAAILDLWRGVGIEPSGDLQSCVKDERYSDWIQANTERVVSDPAVANPTTGGFGTPTIFVNDQRYNGTLDDPTVFAQFVTASSSGADSGGAPTPSPAATG